MNFTFRNRRLEIEYVATLALLANPKNSRRHTRKQVAKLIHAIGAFGFSSPLVIDENNVVLCGNGRLMAAQQMGLSELPCVRISDLSEAEKIALSIADNKLGDESTFDDAALQTLLIELKDLSFDLTTIGFDTGEIDFRLDGAAGSVMVDPADAPVSVKTAEAITRAGDLWQLGDHRLLCGSALEAASFERLLNGEQAEMVFIDPPFNVPVLGHVSGLGKHQHREFAHASGEMSEAQFRDAFLRPALTLLAKHSVDGAIHYVCMDWRHTGTLLAACEGIYAEVKNICVWIKSNGGMGSLYRSQHEFVVVLKNGTAPHINNVELGKHGRWRTNCWDYPGVNSFGPTRDADLADHPTVKPVALVADAIRDCSRRGGLIVDSFGGSGTTILAGEKTGRRVASIEIDPVYVDVAVRRWEALTGRQAVLDGDGRAFADIAAERRTSSASSSEDAR